MSDDEKTEGLEVPFDHDEVDEILARVRDNNAADAKRIRQILRACERSVEQANEVMRDPMLVLLTSAFSQQTATLNKSISRQTNLILAFAGLTLLLMAGLVAPLKFSGFGTALEVAPHSVNAPE